jgi:hypothetical protein
MRRRQPESCKVRKKVKIIGRHKQLRLNAKSSESEVDIDNMDDCIKDEAIDQDFIVFGVGG